jgi:hypothetical protein
MSSSSSPSSSSRSSSSRRSSKKITKNAKESIDVGYDSDTSFADEADDLYDDWEIAMTRELENANKTNNANDYDNEPISLEVEEKGTETNGSGLPCIAGTLKTAMDLAIQEAVQRAIGAAVGDDNNKTLSKKKLHTAKTKKEEKKKTPRISTMRSRKSQVKLALVQADSRISVKDLAKSFFAIAHYIEVGINSQVPRSLQRSSTHMYNSHRIESREHLYEYVKWACDKLRKTALRKSKLKSLLEQRGVETNAWRIQESVGLAYIRDGLAAAAKLQPGARYATVEELVDQFVEMQFIYRHAFNMAKGRWQEWSEKWRLGVIGKWLDGKGADRDLLPKSIATKLPVTKNKSEKDTPKKSTPLAK